MHKLKFTNPTRKREVPAKWSHLIEIYKIEKGFLCKLAILNNAAPCPTNFEKSPLSKVLKVTTIQQYLER